MLHAHLDVDGTRRPGAMSRCGTSLIGGQTDLVDSYSGHRVAAAWRVPRFITRLTEN